jgi:hypothetical protein
LLQCMRLVLEFGSDRRLKFRHGLENNNNNNRKIHQQEKLTDFNS